MEPIPTRFNPAQSTTMHDNPVEPNTTHSNPFSTQYNPCQPVCQPRQLWHNAVEPIQPHATRNSVKKNPVMTRGQWRSASTYFTRACCISRTPHYNRQTFSCPCYDSLETMMYLRNAKHSKNLHAWANGYHESWIHFQSETFSNCQDAFTIH